MNKGIWKLFTFIGFFLAFIVLVMMLVLRFRILDGVDLGSPFFAYSTQQTQEMPASTTQMLTQQEESSHLEADRRNLQRLVQACFSESDCLPSIDHPKFVSGRQASRFLKDDDPVIGIVFDHWQEDDDPVKAYPVKILNWHEVVNDFVNESPVAVTYSPLSMTPRVYNRLLNGKAVEFGVSNMVLNSTPVLYDRETKSLWSQFDGTGLTGPMRDEKLELFLFPAEDGSDLAPVLMRWGDWLKGHPGTMVLSEDTGFDDDYEQYPYGDYETNQDIYFSVEHSDSRRPPKEPVYGIVIDGQEKVYPQAELEKAFLKENTLSDEFAGRKLTLTYNKKVLKVVDAGSKEEIPAQLSYSFVWEAFYPGSQLYLAPEQPVK